MKQAVMVLSLAIMSWFANADATTTVPKSKRVDIGNSETRVAAPSAKQDPVLHRLDLNAVAGLSTPLDVPVMGDAQQTVHISSGSDGSAQIIEDLNADSSDNQDLRDVMAIEGGLQIVLLDRANMASFTYDSGIAIEGKLKSDLQFRLSVVLLDGEGNLVGNETVAALEDGAGASRVEIVSSQPFQKLILTPSSAQPWLLSEVMYGGSTYDDKGIQSGTVEIDDETIGSKADL